ncbi:MAG: hypothetical protein IKA75_07620 [Bacteroidaceae bacterium]|nr:hypothetical protein [Bacteroidaceae bacterium]
MIRKVFFKTMVGAIIIGAAIASCVEVKDLYDPEYAAKLAEYRAKWVEQFGEIDPNEDWGFGSDEETAGDSTRVVTREAIKETHEWKEKGITPPADITEEEINKVNAYLADTANVETISHLNLSDYWIQQVSRTENGQRYLNQLQVFDFSGTQATSVLDANNGETKTVYMQNAGTSGFFCHSSFAGNKEIKDYIIVNIDGALYVCFELFDTKSDTNEEVGGDGIYNDWVVKLTPADYSNTKRIICEDLGTIGDFDFNDIVFDVSDGGWRWESGAGIHEAVITVRAAGGTLPIFVGGVNIKEALGVAEHIMVNTGAVGGMDNVLPAVFRIPWPESNDLRDIEVLVKTNEAICALTAPTGDAPQKLCVPADFVWPSERVNIKTVYENFPNVGWENGKNPNGDVSEYGTLIAAEHLGDEQQPIPAEYFENVGESCTITVVGKNVTVSLRECNWNPNIGIQTEQGGVASVSLTGDLLELAKKGELYCTFHYVENTVAIYVK